MNFNIEQFKHSKKWIGIAVFALDVGFFGFTDPHAVHSQLLIVGFLLLSMSLFFGSYAVMELAASVGFHVGRHHRKAGASVAGVVALLVALQSIGQLSFRDVAVVIPFAVLAYAYVSYGKSLQQP
jgi:hypothetical protein